MRVLSALILVSFLTGCKSDEATKPAPTPPKAQISSSRSKEIAGLLNKKHQLSKKLKTLVATDKIDPTGDLKIIITEQQQAYLDPKIFETPIPAFKSLVRILLFGSRTNSRLAPENGILKSSSHLTRLSRSRLRSSASARSSQKSVRPKIVSQDPKSKLRNFKGRLLKNLLKAKLSLKN